MYGYGDPYWSFAITAEAENTVTSPNSTSSRTIPKSHLSTPTRFAIPPASLPLSLSSFDEVGGSAFYSSAGPKASPRQIHHQLPKHPAAVFIVIKLIEARAGRSQQHHIARRCT